MTHMRQQRFRTFLAFVALNGLVTNLTALFLPLYFQDLGLSGFQSGVYFALTAAAAVLLSLPAGISSDRMSIVGILVVSLVLAAANRLGFLFTRSFGWFCLFALLGSFAVRFYGTASQALFFKSAGGENQRQAGFFMLATYAGNGVGTILGGWLVQRWSFYTGFAAGVVGNLALVGMVGLLPRNETVTIELEEYRKAVLQRNVIVLSAIFFLSSLHWGAESTSYIPFLKQAFGLSVWESSLYAGTGLLSVGLGTWLGAVLLRRGVVKDLQSLLTYGCLLAGVFHILMCVPNLWASLAFRYVHEMGDGFVFLAYYQGIARVFKVEKIGGCAAFVSLWTAIGSLVGALIFGWMGGRYGYQWPLMVSGLVLALVPQVLRLREAGLEGEYGQA
jgi:MFS family permease